MGSNNSGADLRQQLETIRDGLKLSNDWQRRIAHLVNLEQLVLSGAPKLATFYEELKRLSEPLSEQLADR